MSRVIPFCGDPAPPLAKWRAVKRRCIKPVRVSRKAVVTSCADRRTAERRRMEELERQRRSELMAAAAIDQLGVRRVAIAAIIRRVARFTKIPAAQLMGPQRKGELMAARQAIYSLAARYSGKSFPQIGREIGGRDPTTIRHGHRRHMERQDQKREVRRAKA